MAHKARGGQTQAHSSRANRVSKRGTYPSYVPSVVWPLAKFHHRRTVMEEPCLNASAQPVGAVTLSNANFRP